jgi:hypothetical protein
MASDTQTESLLVQLPDACLLAVLQFCADDPRSLFSAARAHSRIHQAAVLAFSSIKVVVKHQQQADRVVAYLRKHGHHISSVQLDKYGLECYTLHQLPHNKLQGLSALKFSGSRMQLQPGDGFEGVLAPGLPLKQLHMHKCTLVDGVEGLVGALSLLPELEHLSFEAELIPWGPRSSYVFPTSILQLLPQLTYLELAVLEFVDPADWQHLQGLTALRCLRLSSIRPQTYQASMLSCLLHLTRLDVMGLAVSRWSSFEPGLLDGKTRLQHLQVVDISIAGGSEGTSQLLFYMQELKRLTYLSLSGLRGEGPDPPAAAYSALTASSKLQQLRVVWRQVPVDVWQHVFPSIGRPLPDLRVLVIKILYNNWESHDYAPAPGASSLVSCCPRLQSLQLSGMIASAELMAPLAGLSSLSDLDLSGVSFPQSEIFGPAPQALEVVCQLTGLQRLAVHNYRFQNVEDGLLLQLTQLQQLTHLQYSKSCMEGLTFTRHLETFMQVSSELELAHVGK